MSEKIGQLKMRSSDGKFYATDCANTETMFRIIQSIPSPKVEPLKRWLARVGKERIDEIENPELAMANQAEKSALSRTLTQPSRSLPMARPILRSRPGVGNWRMTRPSSGSRKMKKG